MENVLSIFETAFALSVQCNYSSIVSVAAIAILPCYRLHQSNFLAAGSSIPFLFLSSPLSHVKGMKQVALNGPGHKEKGLVAVAHLRAKSLPLPPSIACSISCTGHGSNVFSSSVSKLQLLPNDPTSLIGFGNWQRKSHGGSTAAMPIKRQNTEDSFHCKTSSQDKILISCSCS